MRLTARALEMLYVMGLTVHHTVLHRLEEQHIGVDQGEPEYPRASLSHEATPRALPSSPGTQPTAEPGPGATKHCPNVGPRTPDQACHSQTVQLRDTPGEIVLSPGHHLGFHLGGDLP